MCNPCSGLICHPCCRFAQSAPSPLAGEGGERGIRRPLPARLRYTPATSHRWRTRMTLSPFHLAIPVHDLAAARRFYGEVFGCAEGRSSEHWVDFDFFGHQLVIHEHPITPSQEQAHTNAVDGHDVPVPHF